MIQLQISGRSIDEIFSEVVPQSVDFVIGTTGDAVWSSPSVSPLRGHRMFIIQASRPGGADESQDRMRFMIPDGVVDLIFYRCYSMDVFELGVSEGDHILSIAHLLAGALHDINHVLRITHSICVANSEIFRLDRVTGFKW